MSLGNSEFGRE
ncbi:hypothetical protein A2U01_0082149, partial [Trifolium medium]|nr:hypothetical protein [Trifolium medium]